MEIPEAPAHLNGDEALIWQSGYESGYQTGVARALAEERQRIQNEAQVIISSARVRRTPPPELYRS